MLRLQFMKQANAQFGDLFRMFLIDAPARDVNEISKTLSRALRDVG